MNRRISIAPALLAVLLSFGAAEAQNIVLKTVPIPTGEQFLLFPGRALGMGSVSIALDDPHGLPFSNPAHRFQSGDPVRFFIAPTFYGESDQWVGGRTLPISGLVTGERFHGGFGIAVQQVRGRERFGNWPFFGGTGSNIQEDPSNRYLFGTVGARLTDRFSAGVSVLHATLGAVDGVNMLYGRARSIEQDGTVDELRFGFLGDLGEGRRVDGTITRTGVDMVHDVGYMEWEWGDPFVGPQQPPIVTEWQERNEDFTVSWGSRVRYSWPMGEISRVGLILGGTTKDHPKIPNYNVVDIPRDPGNSAVFNLGVGASQTDGGTTIAMEFVFEPGRSHTWAWAEEAIELPSGAELQPGDKTVDNQFRFSNWNLGVGFDEEGERMGWQFGLRVRQINYSLDQHNYLAEEHRDTRESWMEWTPSLGARLKVGGMELSYMGRFTAKGWPGFNWFGGQDVQIADASGPGVDFVVGPTGPVSLPSYRVTTHRLTASFPFGR